MSARGRRQSRASITQKEYLVRFLESNTDLANDRFSSSNGLNTKKQQWEKLSEKLNKMSGSNKNPGQWLKYWQDLRLATRRKLIVLKKFERRGIMSMKPLSDMEMKILAITDVKEIQTRGCKARETLQANFPIAETSTNLIPDHLFQFKLPDDETVDITSSFPAYDVASLISNRSNFPETETVDLNSNPTQYSESSEEQSVPPPSSPRGFSVKPPFATCSNSDPLSQQHSEKAKKRGSYRQILQEYVEVQKVNADARKKNADAAMIQAQALQSIALVFEKLSDRGKFNFHFK